jgi:uncharacterized protein YbjT (DUF2867 family)
MKVTVFGATGRIGTDVVRQALAAGGSVTAVVRAQSDFALRHPALEVVRVPGLTDPAHLRPALDGSDAAISGVGPRSRADTRVASSTVRGILPAMEAVGVKRFVAVSAAPLGPVPDGESWTYRRIVEPLIQRLLRDIYADLRVMEDEIRASATDWTIFRPPRLLAKDSGRPYRVAVDGNPPRGRFVSRAAVARAMLAALEDPSTIGHAIGIAY